MPMNRELYPDDWDEIAYQVKEEADWKCEECGRQCYRPGEKCPDRRNVLTVSHKNHDPADCRRENLWALCSGCHLRYDAKHHAETRRKNREKEKTMEKIKVFISQPMKGKSNDEIIAERERAVESIRQQFPGHEVEVIDSFFQDAPHDAAPLWFLGKSLQLMSTADVVYFVAGWETARGCRIENQCAIEYGLTVIENYKEA